MLSQQISDTTSSVLIPASGNSQKTIAANILIAAGELAIDLQKGSLNSGQLKAAMTRACGASDADGAWSWKDAYEALEVAQILFVCRFVYADPQRFTDTNPPQRGDA